MTVRQISEQDRASDDQEYEKNEVIQNSIAHCFAKSILCN
jgi:hypothetical protein